jgi:hypothetical protein
MSYQVVSGRSGNGNSRVSLIQRVVVSVAQPVGADLWECWTPRCRLGRLRRKRTSMLPSFGAALLAASVFLVADRVPTFDVEEFCHDIAAMAGPIADDKDVKDVCLRQEREARDALVKQWAQFPVADRSFCVDLATIGDHAATYIELLTCLELERAARELRGRSGG